MNESITCNICKREFKSLAGLARHIGLKTDHTITVQEYYDLYLHTSIYEGICENCKENLTSFHSIVHGYDRFCSDCGLLVSNKIAEENIKKKYGVDHFTKIPGVQDKIRKTMMGKYGKRNYVETLEFKNKQRETFIRNWGKSHYLKSHEGLKSFSNKFHDKHSVRYPVLLESAKENSKKYNVENYGVENLMECDVFRKKGQKTINYNNFKRIISKLSQMGITALFEYNDYNGISRDYEYKWKCQCGNIFKDHIDNGHIPRCLVCNPLLKGTSTSELEVYNFCSQYDSNIVLNDRTILNGKELDILLLSHNLAIEFDGLYWHSELNGKGPSYHLEKTREAESRGIRLIHVFEDEWIEKQSIIKNMIKARLGYIEKRVHARKCDVVVTSSDESFEFLELNHIQGNVNSSIKLGLRFEDRLVALLTLGIPRYNDKYEIEILRFCVLGGHIVNGGFSKLFSHFVKKYNPKSVITYSDARFGTGAVYLNNGFNQIGMSKPSYYYMDDYKSRISRMAFQKHKLTSLLESFDEELTEWQNMQLNGYDRIWDCGNYVYEWLN